MAIDPREERRRNAKALAVVALFLLILGGFAYRPATVVGIDGDALASSVGGDDLFSECVHTADDTWRCAISNGSSGARYSVETRSFGCWEAVRQVPGGEGGTSKTTSGCINMLHVVF